MNEQTRKKHNRQIRYPGPGSYFYTKELLEQYTDEASQKPSRK